VRVGPINRNQGCPDYGLLVRLDAYKADYDMRCSELDCAETKGTF